MGKLIGSGISASCFACTLLEKEEFLEESLVVKVLDVTNDGILEMARSEKRILQKLLYFADHCAQIVEYFEHEQENKVYIVLKNAGNKNLIDIFRETG